MIIKNFEVRFEMVKFFVFKTEVRLKEIYYSFLDNK